MHEVGHHTVPERVLTVRLDGSVEYETSDGEVRHVQAGSFVLVEDTHGKGHISRHSAEGQTVIWIALPNGLDLPRARSNSSAAVHSLPRLLRGEGWGEGVFLSATADDQEGPVPPHPPRKKRGDLSPRAGRG